MRRPNRKQMSQHSLINMHCDSMHFCFIYLDDLISTISIQVLLATGSCAGSKLSS
jgi:hypothetical protein